MQKQVRQTRQVLDEDEVEQHYQVQGIVILTKALRQHIHQLLVEHEHLRRVSQTRKRLKIRPLQLLFPLTTLIVSHE